MANASLLTSEAVASSTISDRGALQKRTLAFLLAAVCLLCMLAAEEWLSIGRLSMTFDEGAHLYAGYQHWTARDFGVNPEHPPLVKLVATLPLLAMKIKPPNPPRFFFLQEQYAGGGQMLTENENYRLLTPARKSASLFTFALAILVFVAGWEMFSPQVGLLALALFTFEPNILAHGSLVTMDMGVACCIFAAVFAFYRYLKQPDWLRLALCGIAFGLALAANLNGVLVLPALGLIALREVAVAPSHRARRAVSLSGALLALCFIGCGMLWAVYTFRFAARPAGLSLAPPLAAFVHMGPSPWAASLVLHLASWHLLPEGYLFAWTKLSTPFTRTPAFLFGRTYPTGTWLYFPAALLIKSTLTLIVLLAAAPFVLKRPTREVMVPAISLFTILLACLSSQLNTGVRHVLAIYPFAMLLAAACAWAVARRWRAGASLVATLLIFQVATSLHAYPDYLPYANEAFGGSSKTYRLLTDSNVDWAQQLKEVNAWTASHHVTNCWLAYSYLGGVPSYDQTPCRPLPSGLATLVGLPVPPVPSQIHGTILIAASDAAGVLGGPGSLNPYRQFQDGHPTELIGNSILVYQGDFNVPMVAAESHLSQVVTLLRQGQAEAAVKEIEFAIAAEPTSASVQADAGGAFLQMHKIPEAQRAFATAMRESEALPEAESQVIAGRIARMQHPPF